jgi:hypothetical protein
LPSHRFCGDVMKLQIRVDEETRNDEKIVDTRFKRTRRVADPEVSGLSSIFCDLFEYSFCDLFVIFLFESDFVYIRYCLNMIFLFGS